MMLNRGGVEEPKMSRRNFLIGMILYGCLLCTAGGCDALYRLLHKEGAEERSLLGSVVSIDPNPKVEELQKLLKLHGYNPGAIDGQLGINTRNAVKKFQKDNGLAVNQFVDKATWERLNIFSQSGLVAQGEVDVRKVQTALTAAGMNPGEIDGKMGAKTQRALKAFQRAHGLKADGAIGVKTLSQLMKELQ